MRANDDEAIRSARVYAFSRVAVYSVSLSHSLSLSLSLSLSPLCECRHTENGSATLRARSIRTRAALDTFGFLECAAPTPARIPAN